MKVLTIVFALALLVSLAPSVSAASTTVVPEVYSEEVTFTLPSVNSCNVEANWELGACSYVYTCYTIIPAYQSQLIANAVQKDCDEVSDQTGTHTMNITFVPPPRGEKYIVSGFLTEIKYDWVIDHWEHETIIAGTCKNPGPDGIPGTSDDVCTAREIWYKNAGYMPTVEAIIGICQPDAGPDGEQGTDDDIRRLVIPTDLGDMCVLAKGVCWDTQQVNYCTAKDIYCLDKNRNGVIDEDCTNAINLCMDAQGATGGGPDGICDMKRAIATCTDVIPTGGDGICDVDDAYAQYACDDANLNGICDDVEVAGGICPLIFQPVCDESTWTTYPNSCYADSMGVTYRDGLCEPAVWQCDTYADCPEVPNCNPLAEIRICTEHQCGYSGSCSIQQCDPSAPNPTEFCPEACLGTEVTCSEDTHMCTYTGVCIEKPEQLGFNLWNELSLIWANFWTWIINLILGGG